MNDIATRIKNARHRAGFSQDKMAEAMNLSKGAYSKIERGVTELTVNRLKEIAVILNMDVREFFGIEFKSTATRMDETEKDIYGYASKNEVLELTTQIKILKAEFDLLRTILHESKEMKPVKKKRRS